MLKLRNEGSVPDVVVRRRDCRLPEFGLGRFVTAVCEYRMMMLRIVGRSGVPSPRSLRESFRLPPPVIGVGKASASAASRDWRG